MTLGEKIHELRDFASMTQKDLARELGVSPANVSAWENEKSDPSWFNAVCIADLFGVSLDELAGRTEYIPKSRTQSNYEVIKKMSLEQLTVTLYLLVAPFMEKLGPVTEEDRKQAIAQIKAMLTKEVK